MNTKSYTNSPNAMRRCFGLLVCLMCGIGFAAEVGQPPEIQAPNNYKLGTTLTLPNGTGIIGSITTAASQAETYQQGHLNFRTRLVKKLPAKADSTRFLFWNPSGSTLTFSHAFSTSANGPVTVLTFDDVAMADKIGAGEFYLSDPITDDGMGKTYFINTYVYLETATVFDCGEKSNNPSGWGMNENDDGDKSALAYTPTGAYKSLPSNVVLVLGTETPERRSFDVAIGTSLIAGSQNGVLIDGVDQGYFTGAFSGTTAALHVPLSLCMSGKSLGSYLQADGSLAAITEDDIGGVIVPGYLMRKAQFVFQLIKNANILVNEHAHNDFWNTQAPATALANEVTFRDLVRRLLSRPEVNRPNLAVYAMTPAPVSVSKVDSSLRADAQAFANYDTWLINSWNDINSETPEGAVKALRNFSGVIDRRLLLSEASDRLGGDRRKIKESIQVAGESDGTHFFGTLSQAAYWAAIRQTILVEDDDREPNIHPTRDSDKKIK